MARRPPHGLDTQVLGPDNPRVNELRRLIRRRSSRSAEIVLEGPRAVGEALAAGIVPTTVLVPESSRQDRAVGEVCGDLGDGVDVLVLRDRVFERLAPSATPQPMLAIVNRPDARIPDEFGPEDVVLVLVGVSDPGNVGTLIRVADAIGAVCVVCVGGADPWGQKSVRASAGSVLRVPIVAAPDLADVVSALKQSGARVVGTDVRSGEDHDGGALAAPVAILLGSEPHGLDRSIAPEVDAWVRIDMPGNTESLNVAMAGTLLAYEARRRRS